MKKENNLLYIRVKEQLIAEIKMLQPNDRLPSRAALAKKYLVTRTTIERAISELIGEGYLYTRDCSGTYVAENNNESLVQSSNWGVIVPDVAELVYSQMVRGWRTLPRDMGSISFCVIPTFTLKNRNNISSI